MMDPARTGVAPVAVHRRYVGEYVVLARLGKSVATHTHLVLEPDHDDHSARPLVMKRLLPEIAERDPQRVNSFREGGRVGARMSHLNVARVLAVGDDDGAPFVVSEYLEGQSLQIVARRAVHAGRALPVAVALRMACDVLDGLRYIHEMRDFDGKPLDLVHRDINPTNLFVTYSGMTKVLDFSLGSTSTEHEKTHTGALSVRLPYISPEILRDAEVTPASDVWSLATCLWELLAGASLFGSKSNYGSVQNVVAGPPIGRLSAQRSDVAAWLDDILAKALTRDPSARYQTAAQMKEAIEQGAAAAGLALETHAVSKTIRDLFGDFIETHTSMVEGLAERGQTPDSAPEIADDDPAAIQSSTSVRPHRLLVPTDAQDGPRGASTRSKTNVALVPKLPAAPRVAVQTMTQGEKSRPLWHWLVLATATISILAVAYLALLR